MLTVMAHQCHALRVHRGVSQCTPPLDANSHLPLHNGVAADLLRTAWGRVYIYWICLANIDITRITLPSTSSTNVAEGSTHLPDPRHHDASFIMNAIFSVQKRFPDETRLAFMKRVCHKNIVDVAFVRSYSAHAFAAPVPPRPLASLNDAVPRTTEAANRGNLHLSLDSPVLMSYTCSQSPRYRPFPSSNKICTEQLENASRETNPAYMLMLSSELANESSQIRIRNMAAFALKNNLSAHIKQEVLVTLASPFLRAGGFFAQVVAAIACVELLHDQWLDLIELLGFQPEILSLRSNEILTAMIRGVRHHEPSSGVQLAAAHAPYNSLEFVHENFEREGERNHIMQVMCEATQNPLVSVQVGALECLVKIMALYMEQALLVKHGLMVVPISFYSKWY
ncbi:armadillo-type protein [Pisolithus thermaeus]|nr:armadillo-type protein [Pisolithus thermaeus]